MPDAVVVAIHLSTKVRSPLRTVTQVSALTDRGLEGDRHARAGRGRAVLAALVTATACWIAYTRVRKALESEFERGLERIARTAASQITPELVEEARRSGEESAGYLGIQVQLLTLRSATGVDNASLID